MAARGTLIAIGCVLAALVGLLIPSTSPKPSPAASARRKAKAGVTKPVSSLWSREAEPRVTFARTMPRTHGSQIFNNIGTPNLEMIMVAIPDGLNHVRFVRGTDPVAMRYLAEAREEQKRLVLDNGPADVDTSEIADFGPLKGRTTRRIRNLSADGK